MMKKRIKLPDWVSDCAEDLTHDREFYITKGLGSGGTYGATLWHLVKCLQNQKSARSWCLAPTYQQVIDPLIPTFTEVMTEVFEWEEGEDFEVVLSSFPRIRILKTNQTIFFKSANRPDRLVGSTISHLSGTEPGLWPKEAFQKSYVRVRCPHALCRQKLIEGSPEGLGNEFERLANFDEGLDAERNRVRIILETQDNPHLQDYVKAVTAAYEYDPQKLESYLKGLFVSFHRGSAYWQFVPSRNVGFNLPFFTELPIDLTWDFGVSPLPWIACQRQGMQTKGGLYYHRFAALKESKGEARGLFEACAEFIHHFKNYRHVPIHIYGGHDGYAGSYLTEGCAFEQIKTHLKPYFDAVEIRASHGAPLVRDRLNRANSLFAYSRAIVASECKNLRESLEQTNLKPGTWEIQKPSGKDAAQVSRDKSHFGDAFTSYLYQCSRGEDLTNLHNQQITGFTGRL